MDSICSWRASIMSSCLTKPRRGGVIFSCFFINRLHLEHKKYHTEHVICCSWRAPKSSCLTQPLRDKGGVIFSCFSIQKDPAENDQLLFMMESSIIKLYHGTSQRW